MIPLPQISDQIFQIPVLIKDNILGTEIVVPSEARAAAFHFCEHVNKRDKGNLARAAKTVEPCRSG